MEYARNLKKLALEVSDQMLLVIRAYVEKTAHHSGLERPGLRSAPGRQR